jgi:gamma-glutamyltranspeptidase/glutathione hydrolase
MTCAIAAPSPAAAQAGLRVSRCGGSAVDSAVAAIVVAMCTEPGIVSPLGGGFAAVWPPGRDPEVIDGNVEMPGRGLPEERLGTGLRKITTSYGGGVTMYAGHGSVATPGSFAALGQAHRRHGRLPWADVLAPAIEVTRSGYRLGTSAASYLAITATTLFGWDPQTAALLLDEQGRPLTAGTLIRDHALSGTLQLVADRGVDELYVGELGRAIAADCAAREGLVTAADLTAYRAVVRPALTSELGPWTLATNPPPSIGGPLLTVMLAELLARTGRTWADVIEIQDHVLRYRHGVHDFSEDLEEDGYTLLDLVARQGLRGLALPPPTAPSTVHVSVVDDEGMACGITASSGYGSGATVPGTGLMLNNCLGEPELNRRGVHVLASGTRLASNMAPTVARRGDDAVLAIGSPGADRITTALMQVLARYCLMGVPLADAIDRPRLHVKVVDGEGARLEYEQDDELAAAAAASHLPATVHPARSMYFGGVAAALRERGGELTAAADPRREAATAVG